MADTNYIAPGSGIIQDTEEDSEVIIPGVGIYNEQEASSGGGSILPIIMQSLNQFNGGTILCDR
ncbi:MAG: hypothetical protein U9R60_09630 [Bacteroidota bacterium]|nr:hypothetical protein [Bacteroidota bacterium]